MSIIMYVNSVYLHQINSYEVPNKAIPVDESDQ